MKILIYRRSNYQSVPGGDIVQLQNTAESLQKLGLVVDLSEDSNLDLASYDLVHIFNSPYFDENLAFLKNAQKHQKPIALSTIFWSKEDFEVTVFRKFRKIARWFGHRWAVWFLSIYKKITGYYRKGDRKTERYLFSTAAILLPNSENEMREIERIYRLKKRPYQVVRNAVDTKQFAKSPSVERQDYVLSVGRIEARKNTIALIESCHELGLHLHLIGGADTKNGYTLKCLELVRAYGFEHSDNMDQADILPFYYQAKVHAIASWYETPGLASMEAACGGCNIVTTNYGSTREYFGDSVWYCLPESRPSITMALEEAFRAPANLGLRKRILKDYTWENAARDTLAGYNKALEPTK